MDPLTAIGLVSNIVQLVQFGIATAETCKDIYQSASGLSAKDEALDAAAKNLTALGIDVRDTLRHGVHTGPLSKADQELEDLARDCVVNGDKLVQILHQAKPDGPSNRLRGAFKKTLKSVWDQRKVDTITKDLSRCQSILDSKIIVKLKSVEVVRAIWRRRLMVAAGQT